MSTTKRYLLDMINFKKEDIFQKSGLYSQSKKHLTSTNDINYREEPRRNITNKEHWIIQDIFHTPPQGSQNSKGNASITDVLSPSGSSES